MNSSSMIKGTLVQNLNIMPLYKWHCVFNTTQYTGSNIKYGAMEKSNIESMNIIGFLSHNLVPWYFLLI